MEDEASGLTQTGEEKDEKKKVQDATKKKKKKKKTDESLKTAKEPAYRRVSTWVISAILLGISGGITAGLSGAVEQPVRKAYTTIAETLTGPTQIQFATSSGPLVNIDVIQGMGCDLPGWVFPVGSPASKNVPGEGPQLNGHTWDASPGEFGGVVGSGATLYLSLTGPADHAVIINELTFNVHSRKEPVEGVVINAAPDGCGDTGDGVFHYGAVDLGSDAPYYASPPGVLPEGYAPLRFPYKVAADSPEVLLIDVYTQSCWCSWSATLHWVDGAESGEVVIDNNGQPFEMTATHGLSAYEWTSEQRNGDSTTARPSLIETQIYRDGPLWEREPR